MEALVTPVWKSRRARGQRWWWAGAVAIAAVLVASALALRPSDTPSEAGLDDIPATFPTTVHRTELLAIAEAQSDGMLVPTWLPMEGMTIGRSVLEGDGSYDLWVVGPAEQYVHIVVRPAGVIDESPLVEVSGFSDEDADRVRQSLRVLGTDRA